MTIKINEKIKYHKLDNDILDQMKQVYLDDINPNENIWVFGYGSLMWKPGFKFDRKKSALLQGWQRSFCIYSHCYRGTAQNPGLVLGLDRPEPVEKNNDLNCHGIAFHIKAENVKPTLEYLWDREMVNGVYEPITATIKINNKDFKCYTFAANHQHPQYAGSLSDDEKLTIIRKAYGSTGTNREYLINTVVQLDNIGIEDSYLHRLTAML